MSDEDQLKFEAELTWCLEQLQASLESGKLSQKQGEIQRASEPSCHSYECNQGIFSFTT
jgi:hypothetical protein